MSSSLAASSDMTRSSNATIELSELFEAYADCRHNKRNTMNALAFEVDYERQLIDLYGDINSGRYQPGRSIAFMIDKPVKREIFAADFRDRVVHHLIINKLNPLFERAFIHDSYACRQGRGTHMGIARIDRFIRRCSTNYTRDCYVLKLDVQGFFMAIDKRILWVKLRDFIQEQYHHADQELLLTLCHKILTNNPAKNCYIKGNRRLWNDLPPDKSLFHSAPFCGLPIGNFTSQVFANFYMNPFDHFIKHDLGLPYYGRYVDDFLLVHQDKRYLQSLVPVIADFLRTQLKLTLHPKKIFFQHYSKGVNFLGAVIKPHRITIGKRTRAQFYDAITHFNEFVVHKKPDKDIQKAFLSSMNSYLGIMKHYKTHRQRRQLLKKNLSIWWWNLAYFSGGCAKLVFKQRKARRR